MNRAELIAYLQDTGLVDGPDVTVTALTGGVSSDIRLVSTPERSFVVKRALISHFWDRYVKELGQYHAEGLER